MKLSVSGSLGGLEEAARAQWGALFCTLSVRCLSSLPGGTQLAHQ